MQKFRGTLNQEEYAQLRQLRRDLLAAHFVLSVREYLIRVPPPDQTYAGCVSDDGLELDTDRGSTRLPWGMVSAYAASSGVVLLLIGHTSWPLAQSCFGSTEDWERACSAVRRHVPAIPWRPSGLFRSILLIISLTIVVLLAWHFFHLPSRR
jgi:hypothetical protein